MEILMTIEEVCRKFQVTESCIRAWLHQRRIPSLRIGRLVRFKKQEIDNWLEEKEVEPRK